MRERSGPWCRAEIVAQELVNYEQRLAVVEDVEQRRQQLSLLGGDAPGEQLQQLHLPQVLVEDVLCVFRHLHADEPVRAAAL